MAAEASRAPMAVRERPSIAACQRLRNIAARRVDHATDEAAAERAAPQLRIFDAIPPRYGVIPIQGNSPLFKAGEVAVYDEMWSHEPVQDGGLYVVEFQHPPAGMSWEIYERIGSKALLTVNRSVVRLARSAHQPDAWMRLPLATRENGIIVCADGPIPDWRICENIVGKVVGIYCPAAISGRAA